MQVLGDGHVVPQVPVAERRDPAPLAVILRLLIPMLLSRCGIPTGCMITMVMEKQKVDVFLESVIACKLVILLQNTKGRFLLMWIILHM